MHKRPIFIAIGVLILAGIILGAIFLLSQTHVASLSNSSPGQVFAAVGNASSSAQSITSGAAHPPPNTKEYQNATYHFFLYYPDDLSVREQSLPDSSTAFGFQDAASGQGFEIFITPYTGPTITQARFLMDEPSGVMNDPVYILIDGAAATEFLSTNQAMGTSREIWFIHGGYLYEVTTPQPLDSWLLQIMETWQFM